MNFDVTVAFYGSIIGLVVGLVGGGGSVLGVPILTYLVGVSSVHVAIGTSAVTVGASALLNLTLHSRTGNVDWRLAFVFSFSGALGTMFGNQLGLIVEPARLMFLFSLLMMSISAFMVYRAFVDVNLEPTSFIKKDNPINWKLVTTGIAAGLLAGFFGIGGGVLVVPALIAATRMDAYSAIGSSLVAISLFSIITAITYSYHSLVDWNLAASFTAGALCGTVFGSYFCNYIARFRIALSMILALIICTIGIWTLVAPVR